MKLIKDFISGKNTNYDSLGKTVQEIFQIFLHSPKTLAATEGLAKVLSFFDADRIYIGYFNDEESTISFIHESTAEGVEDATSLLNRRFKHKKIYEEKDYPFWIGNIKNGIDTIISDVDKLPMISDTEIPLMKENHVQSSLTTSIHKEGKVCGFLGIEYVNRKHKWKASDIEAVHFFANIFSVVIENEYMHKEIINSSLEAFKNERIFQIIFETLPVGIELYDENGLLRKINPYDLDLLDAREEDILGVNLFENPNISKECFEQIKKGIPTTFENDYHFDKVNAGYYPSGNKGKVMRLLGKCTPLKDKDNKVFGYLQLVHHDTSYYQKKEELRANLAKLQMAIDAQEAFFWEYDVKNDKTIIDIKSLERTHKEHLHAFQKLHSGNKQHYFEYVHPEDVDKLKKEVTKVLSGQIDSCKESYRVSIEEKQYWLSTCFQIFTYDDNKKPEIIVCLTTDITEQREKDLELIKIREFNHIRTTFVSNISHEIRTPLNAILGFSKVIADSNKAEETQYFNDVIQQNNGILLHMIDSILSFTQIEAGPIPYKREMTDLKEICQSALHLKSFADRPEIEFVFDRDLPSLPVYTDKEYTKQVIYHLLDNANKFTAQGRIALAYRLNENGEALVEISDTGIGLTPEEINKVFDQFYKIDDLQRGVGLGLSIAQRFISDLGGRLGVESKKGEGSRFWFTLPCSEPVEI
ncbi:ATP-binding protein [Parabacteroides sp. PF5-6]|uniref:sensor histidine kinase n=1 Tax=Parabacteroides sp. PF5-6 TaxID=1742403 RepID=UPI0024071CEF|nr:ATP-binding protein [Parabacteroides sp. PF5-6]MDF9828855.1 nitrogen-specific signal transduction histidine kinase [Parabacteroides sp. PF5-6]